MSKHDSAVGSYFGIADIAYDIIARIGPGMLFLCALWPSVVRSQWDDSLWPVFQGIAGVTNWGAGVLFVAVAVFVAYIIGQLMDALVAWWVTGIFAECYYGKSRSNRAGTKEDDWDQAYEACTGLLGVDMKVVLRKAQVESRALANLGVLLILLMCVYFGACLGGALASGWVILAIPLLAIGLFMGSAYCQRYRVWLVCLNLGIKSPVPPEEEASVKKWILLRIWGYVWGHVCRCYRVCRKRIKLRPCILLLILAFFFGRALGESIRAAERADTSTSEISVVAPAVSEPGIPLWRHRAFGPKGSGQHPARLRAGCHVHRQRSAHFSPTPPTETGPGHLARPARGGR